MGILRYTVAVMMIAVLGAAARPDAQDGTPEGPSHTLAFAASSSAGAVFADGSIVVVGEPFTGIVSSPPQCTVSIGIVPALAGSTICRGDLNCDGFINLGDINPFVWLLQP